MNDIAIELPVAESDNSDQVRRDVEGHRLDDLVRVRDHVLARRESRDQRHGELGKLDEPAAAEASRLRRLGRDQVHAHGPDRTGSPRRRPRLWSPWPVAEREAHHGRR